MLKTLIQENSSLYLFLISFVFSLIVGTLLHFTYQLSGNMRFVGYFSAVNESIWEHTKLAAFPLVFFSIYLFIVSKGTINNLSAALAVSLVVAIAVVPVLFYTYTAITKSSIFIVDILIFIIACYISNKIFWYIILDVPTLNWPINEIALILVIAIIVCIGVWTYNPPDYKLFTQIGYNGNSKQM